MGNSKDVASCHDTQRTCTVEPDSTARASPYCHTPMPALRSSCN